jgi:hypothetical protein
LHNGRIRVRVRDLKPSGVSTMGHEQKSNKMDKKKALSTPKEKKAAKKVKKDIKEGIHKPKIV